MDVNCVLYGFDVRLAVDVFVLLHSFFSLLIHLCVLAACTQGCGSIVKASLHIHQCGSSLVHTRQQ